MSLTLSTSLHAMGPGLTTSVAGQGGVEPYVYSVLPGGAGGHINASTGLYSSPVNVPSNAKTCSDLLVVTDANGDQATTRITTLGALGLFCDILQTFLGLAQGRVYLYNQKIFQPKDAGLYIAVGILNMKPFGNTTPLDGSGSGLSSIQSVNTLATLSVNIISRDTSALRRKEEIILALNSIYSQSQQELNSFYVGKLPPGSQFVNLSEVDGAAIPYRFNISVNIQYFATLPKEVPYYDDFSPAVVTTEP